MKSAPPLVSIAQAVSILQSGDVCAMPTETVYGLAADATRSDAVLKIYETKHRPRFNPLIAHCASLEMVGALVEMGAQARRLAELFWPGPLTLVLPAKKGNGISDLVTAGLETQAVRMPAHEIAREIISGLGKPIAAPSANPSGKLSPTSADQVIAAFSGSVPVVDGGPCQSGVESTILTIADGELVQLRAGALARETIEEQMGMKVQNVQPGSKISAPGMLKSHYAPDAALRLNADAPEAGEAWLGFGPQTFAAEPERNLSPTGDFAEAARNLFAMLHQLDATGAKRIAVARIAERGLGEAINDRLRRAAAPRDASTQN